MSIGEFSEETTELLKRLPESALEKLEEDGGSNSGFNSAAFSFALSCLKAGGTEAEFTEAVECSPLGVSYPRNDFSKRLAKTWEDAEGKFDPTYSSDNNGEIKELMADLAERLRDSDLPTGLKASAVALVEIGAEIGTWTVDASARRLALATGLSVATTAKHMKEFKDTGLVTGVTYNGHGQARTFHVDAEYDPPTSREVGINHTHIVLQENMCKVSPHFPVVWSKHGLGPTAHKVYLAVSLSPATASGIATGARSDRKTVAKHLQRLHELGLVIRLDGSRPRYVLNLVPDPERVLEETGALSNQRKQAETFAVDRERFAADLQRVEEPEPRAPEVVVRTLEDWRGRWFIDHGQPGVCLFRISDGWIDSRGFSGGQAPESLKPEDADREYLIPAYAPEPQLLPNGGIDPFAPGWPEACPIPRDPFTGEYPEGAFSAPFPNRPKPKPIDPFAL